MMMISRIFFFLHCQIQLMTFKEFKEFSLIILMLKFDAWLWFLSNFGEVFSNLPLTIQLPLIFFLYPRLCCSFIPENGFIEQGEPQT